MQKQFSIEVPDEIWVNSWEDSRTETYTYDGPETVYALIGTTNDIHTVSLEEPQDIPAGYSVVAVNADQYPERAQMIVETFTEHEYTFEDEENFDGSIYERITNPRLQDYFELTYTPIANDLDRELGLVLDPIYKNLWTPALGEARSRLEYVQKYNNKYDFETADQEKIDTFITAVTDHIAILEAEYPWKFVDVPMDGIPKIPVSLVTLFKDLPIEE